MLRRTPQLRHLVLNNVHLHQETPWLGKLRNLMHLDVSFSSIPGIWDEIGQLQKLETIVALYGQVYEVFPSIIRATRLRILDLRANYPLRLPASLAEMTGLESVLLEGSSFPCVPDAVRAMSILANQHYFDYTPSCEAIPQPIGYAQKRNEACLWDAYYGFWYKAACDGTLLLALRCSVPRSALSPFVSSTLFLMFPQCRCQGQAVRDNVRGRRLHAPGEAQSRTPATHLCARGPVHSAQ
jgi:hypothetical protein